MTAKIHDIITLYRDCIKSLSSKDQLLVRLRGAKNAMGYQKKKEQQMKT